VEVLDGTAEAIPLADGAVDAVTVAQAFHWFDADRALAEIRRVMRPGGGVALLWNRRDESVDWVRRMSEILGWHDRPVSRYQHVDWEAVLTGGGFTGVGRHELRWEQPMTREMLAARVRSISYLGDLPDDEQQRYVDAVLDFVAGEPDEFVLPYVTMVWWATASGTR
jgi:SAM-dependent methyltransferase